ncbi:hypothetical protein DPEC_G00141630 [Dallia pectoralis]|uniref:Uncharacterized protein n=1 Tax=Dallia pectoralis TaxID=75939 RepID=A0ACC2GMW0_DALPE|nr:hypothetical protein DPEC_G00141630 [Dallia pectoralis]
MNISVILLILSGTICTVAQDHEVLAALMCFDHPEILVTVDGDAFLYTDFKKDRPEILSPFTPTHLKLPYSDLVQAGYTQLIKMWCEERNTWGEMAEPSIPEVKDAPESTIYTKDEAELGIKNTLICFVNNFFPPAIKVNWTKNGMDVTEETTLSMFIPNEDGTFHQFSTLSFIPLEGDVYTCTVEHTALEEPKTSCGVVVCGQENYNHLSLNLSGHLIHSLEDYFVPTPLECKCWNCSSSDAYVSTHFITMPRVLMLHVKRFWAVDWKLKKLDGSMSIPKELTLQGFCGDTVQPGARGNTPGTDNVDITPVVSETPDRQPL